MELFHPLTIPLTKYLFFTGKGGVGKTSIAYATAVPLVGSRKRVLLINTDPTSNLQNVFSMRLTNRGTPTPDIPNLVVANLDPIQAAAEYRESVIAPYRGRLSESVIVNMEEQLSGSCAAEIATFNEFSSFTTNGRAQQEYDYIILDTTPMGHTLQMLRLPSAWGSFINESTHGASRLGQLSGLENRETIYKQTVETPANRNLTALILVTRPGTTPFREAERASGELSVLGVHNQILVVSGTLAKHSDALSSSLYEKQQTTLTAMPESLQALSLYIMPLRAYNVTGLPNARTLLNTGRVIAHTETLNTISIPSLNNMIDELTTDGERVIFTMGRGGVGKTTVAAAVALGLAKRGKRVHLTTTDPATHLKFMLNETSGVSVGHINRAEELKKYQSEALFQARASGMSGEDISYVEEDLRSPYTQEIAIFHAFAEVVEKANDQVVVIDIASTGHILLLLESTQGYNHEIERIEGEIPESVERLLSRLKSDETEAVIVALSEATPFYEVLRLEDDLKQAGIATRWRVVDQSLYGTNTTNPILAAKTANEVEWLNRVDTHAHGQFVLVAWSADGIKGDHPLTL